MNNQYGLLPRQRMSVCGAVLFFGFLLVVPSGCQPVIALGRNPKGEALEKLEKLPNYKDGEFQNLFNSPPPPPQQETTSAPVQRRPRWLRMMKYFFGKPDSTKPSDHLPVVMTDLKNKEWEKPTVIWFGHSSFLIKSKSGNLLFDPNFSGFAGPFPGLVDAFKGSNVYTVDDMPTIDAVIVSHDHYDHLDHKTIRQLKKKTKRVIVPVGVGSHLRRWGYKDDQLTELYWNESVSLSPNIKVTATPAHHRSNRTFEQRKTLWASYVIEIDGYKIYFSGDTGYSQHFEVIGEQYGPFDLAMMECGQYNRQWSQSHMFPTQTVKASLDLKAKMVIPIHWGKFAESMHPWNEPVKILMASADSANLPVSIPYIGQPFTIGDKPLNTPWWDFD